MKINLIYNFKTPTKISNFLFLNVQKRYLFNFKHLTSQPDEKLKRTEKKIIEHLRSKTLSQILVWPFYVFGKQINFIYQDFKEIIQPGKYILKQGDCEILYKFNKKDVIDKWITSTDSGYEVGESSAKFLLTQKNTALFCGNLSTKFNKPEETKAQYSGYVNVHSISERGAFMRLKRFDLSEWTHFLLKIKGDGRTYTIVLNTPGFYTAQFTDFYTYPLFTRGGPYWQYAKIPISKFVSGSHGRLTDKQSRLSHGSVSNIGISLMDQNNGPFALEIDYIGLIKDDTAYEEFSYEMYKVPKFISNV